MANTKKKITEIAIEVAGKQVKLQTQLILQTLQKQSASPLGKVKEVKEPNKFVVERADGTETTVTYLGSRGIAEGSSILLVGEDFAR